MPDSSGTGGDSIPPWGGAQNTGEQLQLAVAIRSPRAAAWSQAPPTLSPLRGPPPGRPWLGAATEETLEIPAKLTDA